MRANTTTGVHQEREREFLDALEADTGRTLAQWMDAIRAEGLGERNDIIDWLRRQGFRFSRASWLERVHHNGGKPIYAGQPGVDRAAVRRPTRPATGPAPPPRATAPVLGAGVLGAGVLPPLAPLRPPTPVAASPAIPKPAAEAYAAVSAAPPADGVRDPLAPHITELTAKAKAYRPLADFLLREIAKKIPDATFSVRGASIAIATGREFATLAVSARELKLTLSPGASVTLTDARQVDAALLDRVRAAAATSS